METKCCHDQKRHRQQKRNEGLMRDSDRARQKVPADNEEADCRHRRNQLKQASHIGSRVPLRPKIVDVLSTAVHF